MGCKSSHTSIPNLPNDNLNRLLAVCHIGNQFNVNKKYEHLMKVDQGKEVGTDYWKTHAYYSLVTKDQLQVCRKQFWGKISLYLETRSNGSSQIWETLKTAISLKQQSAGSALFSVQKISLLNNSIQMCLDTQFNKYEIPIFIINQPISYARERLSSRNLAMQFKDSPMEVTIRSTKYPNQDIIIKMYNSAIVGSVKEELKVFKELSAESKIRFFYGGREMKDEKNLGNYGYESGLIIQALII